MFEINSNNFKYTALFCEENIWHLADLLIKQGVHCDELDVIFISNVQQQVVIFNQQSSSIKNPVIWDYHVILLRTSASKKIIYDFDTRASFESDAAHYFDLSFPANINIAPPYQAGFRIIPSSVFIERFSSDRSHMQGIIEPDKFPDYAAIQSNHPLHLKELIDFDTAISANEKILSLTEIKHFLRN